MARVSLKVERLFQKADPQHRKEIKDLWSLKPSQSPKEPKNGHQFLITQNSPVCCTALQILFDNPINVIRYLPEQTLDNKVTKEKKFREFIEKEFELIPVVKDHNCGLRAIIHTLHPTIDPKSEENILHILRGDIIHYVMKHPNMYWKYLNADEFQDQKLLDATLLSYCEQMNENGEKIGDFEIDVMSHILEIPIHVHSYHGEKCFGSSFQKTAIHLYFDPLRSHYAILS